MQLQLQLATKFMTAQEQRRHPKPKNVPRESVDGEKYRKKSKSPVKKPPRVYRKKNGPYVHGVPEFTQIVGGFIAR
jgi:hypothetical protein